MFKLRSSTARVVVRAMATSSTARAKNVGAPNKAALLAGGVLAFSLYAANQQSECWFWGKKEVNITEVRKDIIAAIEADDEKREDGTSIAPTLIRLAWHAAGTYSAEDKTGGRQVLFCRVYYFF